MLEHKNINVDDSVELECGEDSLTPGHQVGDDTVYPTKVVFSREMFSVYEVKRRHNERKTLELAPSYQREGNIWDTKRKSELIESILMGMPLPVFYFFSDVNGVWQVVDGRQRLTTLFDFLENKFALAKDLNILKEICGKKFEELPPFQQGIIEDYSLHINLIKPPTPDRVKFDVFDRVNRGGISLNNQEMRNAIYQGKATELLNELAKNQDFLTVTEKSVSDKRMKDKYIILRFIAFYLLKSESYKNILLDERNNPIEYRSDIDDLLGKIMQFINRADESLISELKEVFNQTMHNVLHVFGAGCFRVSNYIDNNGKNLPVNMAWFESLAYLCSDDRILSNKVQAKNMVQQLFKSNDFLNIIRAQAVDSTLNVTSRFNSMDEIMRKIYND
ncbi:MAG: DUF262 domain-containing protein [Burkholderiales bacterium]|nr:DUF262 domain-containing protein [Burkholderiales bacterium]